jgi:DNA-binding MarR family transcriptional regulator
MPSARRASPDPSRPRLTYLVGRLNRVLRRRLGDALAPLQLSVPQYTTLSVLHARGNLSNAELAKRAFISPQAMNEVIQGLEARKLVTRRASASHGRIVQLLLTQPGLALMHECDTAVQRLEQRLLGGLTALEKKILPAALASCAHALEHPAEPLRAATNKAASRRRTESAPAQSSTRGSRRSIPKRLTSSRAPSAVT